MVVPKPFNSQVYPTIIVVHKPEQELSQNEFKGKKPQLISAWIATHGKNF